MTSEEILSDNLLESISEKIDLQQRQCELRKYFASQLALALNSNADPKEHKLKEAWDQYCIDLSQDFLDRHISEDAAIGDAYLEIDRLLFKKTGQHINKIEGFYAPIFFDEIGEDDIDIKDTAFKLYNSLSQEQLEVVDTILEAVKEANTDQPNCYYLSGSAGTGKTYIYKTIWHCLIKGD
jgi:DNA replication protein DnaC